MKLIIMLGIIVGAVALQGCCTASKQAILDVSHAINNDAEVVRGETANCRNHDKKACTNVEEKLMQIIAKAKELETLAK